MASKVNSRKDKYGDSLTATLYERESKKGNSFFSGRIKIKSDKNVRAGEEITIYLSTTANIMKSKYGNNSNVILVNFSTIDI